MDNETGQGFSPVNSDKRYYICRMLSFVQPQHYRCLINTQQRTQPKGQAEKHYLGLYYSGSVS
jgi:hypothetical protein